MAKKEDKSIFQILFKSLEIYVMNLRQFITYMAFPVLGQLVGILMTMGAVFAYSSSLPSLVTKFQILNNFSAMTITVLLIAVPGMFILTKAFWDYMIAYGALNSMAQAAVVTGKVYDFKAHNDVVYSKIVPYLAIWLLFGIYTAVASIPFFFLLWIFFIYFVLIFQVFTFEDSVSPIGCFKKSFDLIKGKFARTFILMAILFGLTYYLITMGISVIFDFTNLTKIMSGLFSSWCSNLPLDSINHIGSHFQITVTSVDIAKMMINQVAMLIAAGFTLPLRCIAWTLWYENLNDGFDNNIQKIEKKSKRISKKKPKTTSFKIESRKIDPEIIRRARMEDDEY
ncbi:MAG: hypothetical protein LKG27_03710 [Clostridiaceae bacterium]|jgi:hypothetical protein|nr:hypothetical protein [Clostridiaceae bacterium]